MSVKVMIKSNRGNVMDIKGNSTQQGAGLDAFPPKVDSPSLDPNSRVSSAPNQTWEVLPDPAGSSHHIIMNPATGHCIDIQGNSLQPGARLDVFPPKSKDNENQLWDFLPDPFGSGSCFIQNPQTGYVIDTAGDSSAKGASLRVNFQRIFGNAHQLWTAVDGSSFEQVPLPSLILAATPSPFGSNLQYVLLPPNQNTPFKKVIVTIDIIEDLIADSFTIQINGTAAAPADGSGAQWDAQWLQYGLIMADNTLALFNQVWHKTHAGRKNDPLESVTGVSGSMLQLSDNTVPSGTQIVLTLTIDPNSKDFATGVSGQVFDGTGAAIGTPQNWSVIGQPDFHGATVQESDLAPLGAISVVIVGRPSGNTNFSFGMGTLTVACDPKATVSTNWNGPDTLHIIETGEKSNCYYGQVPQGSFKQVVQPFGVPSPKVTTAAAGTNIAGTGMYPNSKLTVTAHYSANKPFDNYISTQGTVQAISPTQPDGSFAFIVVPQDPAANNTPGVLAIKVTDSQGNSVGADITAGGTPEVISTRGTPRLFF